MPEFTTGSWPREHWASRYRARGYRVLAPNWPGMDGAVEQLRRDPSAVAGVGVSDIVEHYDRIVRELGRPPVIIGHCLGGLVVQILLGRGLGAAGVAIDPAPAKRAMTLPWSMLKARFPAMRNPANRHHAATRVDYGNDDRAPLLLIAGGKDYIFPALVTRSNFQRYRTSKAVTAYKEFPDRSHYTIGEPGWERVADYALRWAMDNARNGT